MSQPTLAPNLIRITIQYIATNLQQAGAHEIYGLSLVKTLRDTDNV